MQPARRVVSRAVRLVVAGVCLFAMWDSWKLARADFLFRQDTKASIREAIRLAPDASAYSMRLAQLDDDHAQELLERALRLDPYNAQADIELGLRYEAEGDAGRAEKLLLHAYSIDHTYVPRWSLANFYLRQGNIPAFWTWARAAAQMPADDVGALFLLCWRVSPDPAVIEQKVLNDNPAVIRQYLRFLLGVGQLDASARVAAWLVRDGSQATDGPLLFSLIDGLVQVGDAGAATNLWHGLQAQGWVPEDKGLPYNGSFARPPQPVRFDWALGTNDGLHSWPGPSGLEAELNGNEPESCTLAEQTVALAPGNYSLAYSYRTENIPPDTGIRWQIVDAKSGKVLAESPSLSSTMMLSAGVPFTVGPETPLLQVRLGYQRALGTVRVSGAVVIRSTRIQTRPSA